MDFQAYQDIICLPLLWQMKDLIVRVANETKQHHNRMRSLFGERKQQTMEEAYQFRYPGEVLERYKDRCGDTRDNMRALAIALAESKEILEADMFIGNQQEAFINSIRMAKETDIYLCGALYRLTDRKTEKEQLKEKLLQYVAETTQEYVYLQSVFFLENTDYEADMKKWNHFLGNGRTIKAYGNESVYAWFLNHFMWQIQQYRKKGAEILKALMQLPVHQVRYGNMYWDRLLAAGYSIQEICFLNMNLPFLSNHAERIFKDSITMERIVAYGCKEILNAEKVESPLLFGEVTKFLLMYQKFAIRLEETKNLTDYLSYIKIRDVDLFLYLYMKRNERFINDDWLLVDLTEDRWDKLADVLDEEQYLCLFEQCFCCHIKNKNGHLWLEKYEKLKKKSYGSQLWKHSGDYTEQVLRSMVQTGDFNPVELLEKYIQERKHEDEQAVEEKWSVMLEHMQKLACNIFCHEVFRFWEVYEQAYGMEKLRQFLGNQDYVSKIVKFEKYSYHGYRNELWNGLEYLTAEEQRKLFYWECDELYYHDLSSYNKFLLQFFLKKCFGLFTKEESRETAETLLEKLDKNSAEARKLREIYYSEAELKTYEEEEIRQKEEKERLEEIQRREEWMEELTNGLADENRSISRLAIINKNARLYIGSQSYYEMVYLCILKELNSGNCQIESEKLSKFLELLAVLLSKKVMKWKEVCEIIQKLEVEEDELADD